MDQADTPGYLSLSSWNRDVDGTLVCYQDPNSLPISQDLPGENEVGGHLDFKSDSPGVELEYGEVPML